ncbi:hypothetical protein [Hansschlegelia sp. KR7-227]|uniref:hypothetical protein n=1 Tax=Hansschlegelia sp. KR7-227 TaxID=3400914 RepID=UPI003C013647
MKLMFAAAAATCLLGFAGTAEAAALHRGAPASAQAGQVRAEPVGVRCDGNRATRRVCVERRTAYERREARRHGRVAEDEGGPYGPTLTNDYYFQQSMYDFQDGKKANLKEYK